MRILVVPILDCTHTYHIHVAQRISLLFVPPSSKQLPVTIAGLFHRTYTFTHKQWDKLVADKTSAWKRKIVSWGHKIAERTEWEESFCKGIPWAVEEEQLQGIAKSKELGNVEIWFPSKVEQKLVEENLRKLLEERWSLHRWWTMAWTAGIPVSMVFAVLPGPNLPLFYTLYRLFSHYRAYQGTITLRLLLPRFSYIPSRDLSKLSDTISQSEIGEKEVEKVLEFTAKELDVQGLRDQVVKARHQVLSRAKRRNQS